VAAKPALWSDETCWLTNAHKPDEKAYAVVQLRFDNALGTCSTSLVSRPK